MRRCWRRSRGVSPRTTTRRCWRRSRGPSLRTTTRRCWRLRGSRRRSAPRAPEADVSGEAAVVPRVRSLVPALPRAAWVVLAGDAVSALGSGLTLPFLLVYLHQARGLDLGPASLAVATVAIAGLAGNPFGGALSDRVGARAA